LPDLLPVGVAHLAVVVASVVVLLAGHGLRSLAVALRVGVVLRRGHGALLRARCRGGGRSGSVRSVSAVPVPLPEEAASPPAPSGPRLGALQQRDFRLLWLGMVASQTGSWMQQITQNWLLWELTHSALMLGLYGLCRSVPFIACSLYAGALADRVDRRRLLILTNCVNATLPLAVGALVALGRVEPWHIYLAACCSAV